jgi:hypothetical protein
MASKALSKEVRGLISTARTKTTKRLKEQNSMERISGGLGGTAGAIAAALVDRAHRKKAQKEGKGDPDKQATFEVMGMNIPTNLVGGAAVAAGGMLVGKGEVGAGLVGAGFTALNISVYRLVLDKDGEDEEDDEDEN